jgi:hypothetical protein
VSTGISYGSASRAPNKSASGFGVHEKKMEDSGETAVFHAILISCGNNTAWKSISSEITC